MMKKLSFCITCKNRFYQLSQTLPVNLADNLQHQNEIEFVLVDFNSEGGLKDWLFSTCQSALESNYLKYIYTESIDIWHAPIAKNTAHNHASGEFLVNLDGDNFTGKNGGAFVLEQFEKYGQDLLLHQFRGEFEDGSFGRVGMSKKHFQTIRGYDESLLPMLYEDIDLIKRLQLHGLRYELVNDPAYNKALINTKEDSLKNTGSELTPKEMNRQNFIRSKENLAKGKIIARQPQMGITENIYQYINGSLTAIS